jgi:hypothetical protein
MRGDGIRRDSLLLRHLAPHRSRCRADFGTLAAEARLPGGQRVRTLAPLLMCF